MKKLVGMLMFLIFIHLCIVIPVSADPRMEINDNFCHFILDPTNTDNEVFVANCRDEITTIVPTPTAKENMVTCENYIERFWSGNKNHSPGDYFVKTWRNPKIHK
jgi:hypothetical protein